MTFNGGGTVITDDGVVELPDYIEVLSKEEIKVRLDGGWEGTHIITVTPEDVRIMAEVLGTGIMTKSCIIFKGVAWNRQPARDFVNEMWWWFKLLKENHYGEKD